LAAALAEMLLTILIPVLETVEPVRVARAAAAAATLQLQTLR
jgi:hypothetical protein